MLIGHREFTEGTTRPVYLDDNNQQYVVGEDGDLIFGEWLVDEYGDDESLSNRLRARPQDVETADVPIILRLLNPESSRNSSSHRPGALS